MRNLRWFEVTQMRGEIEGGQIQHYQVTMKVGFTSGGLSPWGFRWKPTGVTAARNSLNPPPSRMSEGADRWHR